eukprot:TRINITY_DN1654_c0_g1_i5.p5 TRINITY_DN1654_c0_g1~~TRINITY_DN1654_c0_g1_i5.p5  ORF type:complete len:132 (+),score=21.23 TRINITY_DN1654_c0_g1_i5:1403-1798(+)
MDGTITSQEITESIIPKCPLGVSKEVPIRILKYSAPGRRELKHPKENKPENIEEQKVRHSLEDIKLEIAFSSRVNNQEETKVRESRGISITSELVFNISRVTENKNEFSASVSPIPKDYKEADSQTFEFQF